MTRRYAEVHKEAEPRYWVCECGVKHQFGGWYAAHTHLQLQHTCECGLIHQTKNYEVWMEVTEC